MSFLANVFLLPFVRCGISRYNRLVGQRGGRSSASRGMRPVISRSGRDEVLRKARSSH